MCCIFTCCGWMIDLLQRLWTFTMSCCISSAVCCTLLTGSMSGVALGYNYSLAEYVELKETNVSVFLKRGIFDDDLTNDMNFRRGGHLPVGGLIRDDNLITAADLDESSTLKSGRRLEESIFDSNEKNNFEGSLMKLTAKPPHDPITQSSPTPDLNLLKIKEGNPSNQLEQLKEIQNVFNARKMAAQARLVTMTGSKTPYIDERMFPNYDPAVVDPESGRRAILRDMPPFPPPTTDSSLRAAVPSAWINDPLLWALPRMKSTKINMATYDPLGTEIVQRFTFPTPLTRRPGPARPTKQKPRRPPTHTTRVRLITPGGQGEQNLPKSIDEEMDIIKEREGEPRESVEVKSPPNIDYDNMKFIALGKGGNEDYGSDIKGVPVRKKRKCNNFIPTNIIPKVNRDEIKSEIGNANSNNIINKNNLYIRSDIIKSESNNINTIPNYIESSTRGPNGPTLVSIFKRKENDLNDRSNKNPKENVPINLKSNLSNLSNQIFIHENKVKIMENSNSATKTTAMGQNIISNFQTRSNKSFTSSTMIKLLITASVP